MHDALAGREPVQCNSDLATEQQREQIDGPAPIGEEPVRAP